MSTTQQLGRSHVPEQPAREARNAHIGGQVIHALGRPEDLVSVQVRGLWGDYYRVNVFVGGGATSARVANSYFLTVDAVGTILAASPTIIRQYGSGAR